MMSHQAPDITPELLTRYNIAGPRYTSYPTADRFTSTFGETDLKQALQQRQYGSSGGTAMSPLSVYVHIPFCASLCYFCACNKIITRHHEQADEYLQLLQHELTLYYPYLAGQPVSQLHLGGGSPTFFSDALLTQLMHSLHTFFTFESNGEYSIEVDPRTVDIYRLQHLAGLGFNRISFGVQDFDEKVQQAVHRIQPTAQVFTLVQAARDAGFTSVNIDLIYGLPLQSSASFANTLQHVCDLRPDRIALYAYAHLPERFKPQRRINTQTLPNGSEKVGLLALALQKLNQAGYLYVGMDHFALPNDSLAQAKRQARLQRNFQGYSTQPDCDLVGLGVSAIGRIGDCYSQNTKTLPAYRDQLEKGLLPIERGRQLTRDDQIRRAIIMAIMCQGEVAFDAIGRHWQIAFEDYFAAEIASLTPLQEQNLVTLNKGVLRVTSIGWYFVRAVAMVFDNYLQQAQIQAQFSKIL